MFELFIYQLMSKNVDSDTDDFYVDVCTNTKNHMHLLIAQAMYY